MLLAGQHRRQECARRKCGHSPGAWGLSRFWAGRMFTLREVLKPHTRALPGPRTQTARTAAVRLLVVTVTAASGHENHLMPHGSPLGTSPPPSPEPQPPAGQRHHPHGALTARLPTAPHTATPAAGPVPEDLACSRASSPPRLPSCTASLAGAGLAAFSWRRCCFLSCRSFRIIFKTKQAITTPKYLYF